MEIEGKIVKAFAPKSGISQRGDQWMSQEFLLEYGSENYKRKFVFEVFGQDRLHRFAIKEGQTVNVSLNIEANEYNGRWYNRVRAFDVHLRIAVNSEEGTQGPAADATGTMAGVDPNDPFGGGNVDALPFD